MLGSNLVQRSISDILNSTFPISRPKFQGGAIAIFANFLWIFLWHPRVVVIESVLIRSIVLTCHNVGSFFGDLRKDDNVSWFLIETLEHFVPQVKWSPHFLDIIKVLKMRRDKSLNCWGTLDDREPGSRTPVATNPLTSWPTEAWVFLFTVRVDKVPVPLLAETGPCTPAD